MQTNEPKTSSLIWRTLLLDARETTSTRENKLLVSYHHIVSGFDDVAVATPWTQKHIFGAGTLTIYVWRGSFVQSTRGGWPDAVMMLVGVVVGYAVSGSSLIHFYMFYG